MLLALRTSGMLAWLLLCLPFYLIMAALPTRNVVPRHFLGGVVRQAGVRLTITGFPPSARAILISNHVSWLDIPVLAAVTGTAFVAHEGLARHPFLRWLCRMNHTVFVARERRVSVARQVEQVREALDKSPVLTLFPEGTTGNGRDLLPFKSTLLAAIDPPPAGVTIQPVLVDYGESTAGIAWVGNEPGIENYKRIVGRRENIRARVHFLPPLSGAELADRKTMAMTARARLRAALAELRAPSQ